MINIKLAKSVLIIVLAATLQACLDDDDGPFPVVEIDNTAQGSMVETEDSSIILSGTATSDHPILSVKWSTSHGGSGTMLGLENWQSGRIPLLAGVNTITITAQDDAGNINSKAIEVKRNSGSTRTGNDTSSDTNTIAADSVLMYSYSQNLANAAPLDGANLDPGYIYLYVVPSTEWRERGIEHVYYYCCDDTAPSNESSAPPRMAVSFEPWSMAMDMAPFADGDYWSLDVEAALADGSTSKANEYLFTVNGSPGQNTAPNITGNPPDSVTTGNRYDFTPGASDADADTLSFSVQNLPLWANFNTLSGRLWGTPQNTDAGVYSNIRISVTDGKVTRSLPAFSVSVTNTPGDGSGDPSPPRINSFEATPAAITAGQSTTLSWNVTGATSISINEGIGTISGNSIRVSPQQTTTYRLAARNAAGETSQNVTVSVLSGSSDWNVQTSPPSLSSPRYIDVATHPTRSLSAYDIHCGGLYRRIFLNSGEDAVIYMTGSNALKYPLHVTGGRNVRLVGLDFDIETQAGCGVGELPNKPVNQYPNANIHPRIPGGIVLRVEQSHSTYIEGLNIDVRGHQADCIVSRNPDSLSAAQARNQRDITIQNTYCSGVEGMGQSDIGDGVHGDLFQNQGNDVIRNLIFENVSMRTSQEGIVVHGGGTEGGKGTVNFVLRRYDYTWDPRYVGDDNYEQFGLAMTGKVGADWTLDDVFIDDYRDNGDYLQIDGQRYGSSASTNVLAHPEIRSGLPTQGAFALPGRTGLNYTSPHGGVPGN